MNFKKVSSRQTMLTIKFYVSLWPQPVNGKNFVLRGDELDVGILAESESALML
jgi:hypothetical protein